MKKRSRQCRHVDYEPVRLGVETGVMIGGLAPAITTLWMIVIIASFIRNYPRAKSVPSSSMKAGR